MRVLSRLLKLPACTSHGRLIASPCLIPFSQRRRSHNGRLTRWSLNELSRVSEETGPFVFHLPSDDPYLNLSIEHYLLSSSHPDSHILLFYTNRPSVIIGRNQNPWLEVDLKRVQDGLHQEDQSLGAYEQPQGKNPLAISRPPLGKVVPVDFVRRRSGGGTVFHDSGNLNYSVIVPNNRAFTRNKHAQMVVQALQSFNNTTHQSSTVIFPTVRVNDRNDIVMQRPKETEWLKVSGSAYKLTRGRALHHGTLLYSSPYLHSISDLLRSPGREFITASGIESVRTKVGNLAWKPRRSDRHKLKRAITDAIVREFWDMYKAEQSPQRIGENQVFLTLPTSRAQLEKENFRIAQGVQELMSPSWLFESTPKFDYKSGMLENHEVDFYADKGVLKTIELSSPIPGSEENPGGVIWRRRKKVFGKEDVYAGGGDNMDNVKLHEVEDWKALLADSSGNANGVQHRRLSAGTDKDQDLRDRMTVNVPDMLVKRLEAMFPVYTPRRQGGPKDIQ